MAKLSQETIAVLGCIGTVIAVGLSLAALQVNSVDNIRSDMQALREEARADRAEAIADRAAIRDENRADREAFEKHIIRLTQSQGHLTGIFEKMQNQEDLTSIFEEMNRRASAMADRRK